MSTARSAACCPYVHIKFFTELTISFSSAAHLEWMDESFVRARKLFDSEVEVSHSECNGHLPFVSTHPDQNEIGTPGREVPVTPEISFKWSQLNAQIKSGVINNSSSAAQLPTPRQESSDNLKSFKVSFEDPAWKVLPAALRKYKINGDDWQNYAMFICYGPQST